VFDPAKIVGAWPRTKWPRPEAELTFTQPIGELGKLVLFTSGIYQRVYLQGKPDSTYASAKGIAYGGRLELGRLRLGLAGHYGRGLGLYNTLESSAAVVSQQNQLRWVDAYSALLMVVLGKVDVSFGWGITRVFLNAEDLTPYASMAINPSGAAGGIFEPIKYQQGFSCGAVYHVKPWLHIDVDLFRANFVWYAGDTQVDWVANSGMLFTW
jgi:hypothetical protein